MVSGHTALDNSPQIIASYEIHVQDVHSPPPPEFYISHNNPLIVPWTTITQINATYVIPPDAIAPWIFFPE